MRCDTNLPAIIGPGVLARPRRDRAAACVVACHPEQGWSLLCNGVVLFDDAKVLVLGHPVTSSRPCPRAIDGGVSGRWYRLPW